MVDLASVIEELPAYSGKELGCRLYREGEPPNTDAKVLLVGEEHRDAIAKALRAAAPGRLEGDDECPDCVGTGSEESHNAYHIDGGFLTITGDIGTYHGAESMGIDWMSGAEMSEAIPPAFSEYIGSAALAAARPRLVEAAE